MHHTMAAANLEQVKGKQVGKEVCDSSTNRSAGKQEKSVLMVGKHEGFRAWQAGSVLAVSWQEAGGELAASCC